MDISFDDLYAVIGAKEIVILKLRQENRDLRMQIETLMKEKQTREANLFNPQLNSVLGNAELRDEH